MKTSITTFVASFLRFWVRKDGGVFVYGAVVIPVLLGSAGLSVDVGLWYLTKRSAQAAADSAALAAAYEGVRSADQAAMLQTALKSATDNGYDSSNGDTITINIPPTSGDYAGSATEVEAIVQRSVPGFLSRILVPGDVTVAARAVATTGVAPGPGDGCLWTTDPSGSGALTIRGNANINIGCGIHVNSNHANALDQGGASCVNASSITVVGGSSGSCLNPTPTENVAVQSDPLSTMHGLVGPGIGDIPSTSGCDSSNYSAKNKKTLTLPPGCYSGTIEAKPGGTLIFSPGNYTLDDASIDFKGTVQGNGVSFFVTANSDEPITVNSQADINLVAHEDANDPMAGILFYQDPNATGGIEHHINGGSDLYMEGIVYFSKDNFRINGGSSQNQSPTYLVAHRIHFSGGSEFGNYEGSAGQSNPYLGVAGGGQVSLVE